MSQPLTDDLEEQDWLDHTWRYVKQRPYVWAPLVVVVIVLIGFFYNRVDTTQPFDTDPTVANRPLSNQDQHLHTLAIDPVHPGIVYLGSHYGLFLSTDDGKTWPQKRGMLNEVMITSLSASPLASGTVGVIGIEPNGGNFGQNGIYITHDNGATWQRAKDPVGVPANADRYLIVPGSASVHSWLALYVGVGLFATADDGQTWQLLRAPASSQDSQRVIWVAPNHPNTILLGSNLGLQVTQDGGAHWSAVPGISDGVYAISNSAADPNTVYVATDSGVYRSQDGGLTFTKASDLISSGPFARLASSAQHPNVLYGLVGQEVWRSGDGGVTWTQQQILQTSHPMNLLVAPDDDQHLYVGFYSPAVASESLDGGKTWNLIAS